VSPRSVLAIAPLRISFLGGGTDIQSFYKQKPGAVISAAIDKYVYVHVKQHDPLFQERYRISYSEVEHCQSRDEIKNDIVRASLELLKLDVPLQISTSADLPANSGLGSSSSFAVALLLALHGIKGERVGSAQLAEEACKVEIDILKSPIGKQDQYAAAFGGINLFEFLENDSVRIEPIPTLKKPAGALIESAVMIWTQQARSANTVLKDQESRIVDNFNNLNQLLGLVTDFRNELLHESADLSKLGNLIDEGWAAKVKLSPMISTTEIQEILDHMRLLGSKGAKLLGAGGGGFVFSMHENPRETIKQILKRWPAFQPSLDHEGARIVSYS
jgi:D-glycero-alpha-D-manno-heptose-7-phosphate kinase